MNRAIASKLPADLGAAIWRLPGSRNGEAWKKPKKAAAMSASPSLKARLVVWLSRIRRRNDIMSTAPAPVSDMLATVKSREVQRALLAEMRV
jgi:hypothetical protein